MIPLPQKLKDTLALLDQRKNDLLQGWLMSLGELEGDWSLAPDFSALVKREDKNGATTTESS